MASRRQFDNSYSRRGGGGGVGGIYGAEEQYGGGGGGGYDQYEDYGGGGYDQDERSSYDHIPRDAPRNVAGGWRQRSPSPRFRGMNDGGDRLNRMGGGGGVVGGSAWNRGQDQFIDNSQQQQMAYDQPQQQNLFQTNAILRNTSLLGQPEAPLVMVLPQAQPNAAANLMGNLGMVQAQNPLGMFGQQVLVPSFNAPFGQQVMGAGTPFGQGVADQGLSSIYGPQTQQPLNNNRFDSSRSRDIGRSGPSRRSETSRNDSSSNNRKRNLIPRDPRPEDNKRARHSGSNSNNNRGNNNNNNKRHSGVARTLSQLKRQSGAGGTDNKQNASPKKKADTAKPVPASNAKVENKAKKEDDSKSLETKKGEKLDKDRKTKFDEIPTSLLVCKVCQKAMNDGASYESHLSGRAHLSLMKILEERFTKRAELLMTESKCSEDEIGIEKERQRRAGKSGRAEKNSNNYCKMCDCNYTINWGTHKVSLGHRVLKEFLHPTCRFCKTHFMHRIDWVTHMLSASHLKKLADLKAAGSTTEGNGPTLEDQETPSQDELFAVYVDLARDERTTNAITVKSIDGKQSLTEEMKDILKNDRGEIVLPEGEIPIPETFVANGEPVGEEAIVEVSGSRCRVCRVYIPEDKDKEEHCKTKDHFQNYVSFLKRVMRYREHKQAEKKAAEEKLKKENEKKSEKNNVENGDEDTAEGGMDEENEEGGEEMEEDEMVVLDQVDADDSQEDGEDDNVETTEEPEVIKTEAQTVEDEPQGDVNTAEDDKEQVGDENLSQEVAEGEEVQGEAETNEANENDNWPQIVSVEGNAPQPSEVESNSNSQTTANTDEDTDTSMVVSEEAQVEVIQAEIIPEEKRTRAASPAKPARGGGSGPRGRGVAVRGTPLARGGRGGNQTPASALKNVAPRVDSNIRGGAQRGVQRGRPGRGSPRGVSGARGPRGGRGGNR